MATLRSSGVPYGAFNFTVSGGPLSTAQPYGGFQEVSGLGMEVTEAEYRTGSDPKNYVQKVSGLTKATDVTLKRGIVGLTDLSGWIKNIRDADYSNINLAGETIIIKLMDEAQVGPVMTWTLTNAKAKSYKGVTLNAKGGTDVAIEELVLSVEAIDVT